MGEVARMMRDAIQEKGLSMQMVADEVSKTVKVHRSFISRLMDGQPPPRKKAARQAVDERYRRIAAVLDLDEDKFLAAVRREQNQLHQGEKRKVPASDASVAAPIDFESRYPELWTLLAGIPLNDESALKELVKNCLMSRLDKEEAEIWVELILEKTCRRTRYLYSHMQDEGSLPEISWLLHENAQICRRIAEELTDDVGEYSRRSRERRVEIASMFYEIAHSFSGTVQAL